MHRPSCGRPELLASVLAERGRSWRLVGWSWTAAMSAACVLNGAQAVLDAEASWVVWAALSWLERRSRSRRNSAA